MIANRDHRHCYLARRWQRLPTENSSSEATRKRRSLMLRRPTATGLPAEQSPPELSPLQSKEQIAAQWQKPRQRRQKNRTKRFGFHVDEGLPSRIEPRTFGCLRRPL